ncbi:ParA family protein [Rickettsiales endosymbiont of Peranema trichophorum]|uniref:ParA family protein n=1 Tax=Rickettsiales endosymbiont of Peranema trichophorum TaxID=2486577 RepID=UPI001023AE5E|nr:ParA family protein [Rickettsiales endosymbiont of Peranema trichophorum]RZI47509.1 ParA family protein [Rickettsiales endosymbiont of Peranema trichophorum]
MEVFNETQPKVAATHLATLLGVSLQAIHKQLKAQQITCPKMGNKSYITHSIARKLFNLNFERQKICFQIVKGGTGKTTALHNISCAASLYGAKILLIDLDPQGNLTDAFNVDADNVPVLIDVIEKDTSIRESIIQVEDGIYLLPSRIENVTLDSKLAITKAPLHNIFKSILGQIENEYDFIFIDCPPMMGHSVTAASLYSDLILVPLNPDKFSAKGLKILKNEINNISAQYQHTINYRVFLNKFSGNTILSDKAIQTTIAAETDLGNAFTTAIRQSQEIPNATDMNQNLFSSLKRSTAKDDFDLLTRELLKINIQELSQRARV